MGGMLISPNPKIIVALDGEESWALVERLSPDVCRLKVGKAFFTCYGPQGVQRLQEKGFDVFLDLKFHDIPEQVGGACQQAAKLGVWMLNVHALGGEKMLKAAKAAVEASEKKPLLIGVTLLTSLGAGDLLRLRISESVPDLVMHLAGLCYEAGLDGVVCSAQEATQLKEKFGSHFLCVTPGIRLAGDDKQDQQRVMTPEAAFQSGSDYLVVGRSITQAAFPEKVLQQLNESVPL